jgi:16S rRNA (guanine(1405)-N(7))-methyltransferase
MPDLDAVVSAVASAAKYRTLCEESIRRVAQREIAAQPSAGSKALVKATKRRLHQVYGAFEERADYAGILAQLEAAYQGGSQSEIEALCRQALALHSSTRERLPLLDSFFPEIWAVTGRPRALLDLGCGLNPLALPWMGLDAGARYVALDIDRERVRFLNRTFALAGMLPLARCQDVLVRPPDDPADVALLLKMSPTLESQEPGATGRLLEALLAPFAVVSFAVKSLGGREKGMAATYQRRFLELAAARHWTVSRLGFETELLFVVQLPVGRGQR